MSNVIAGVVRGQYEYLEEHIEQKKLSLDYKNYVTLLGKPANFTDPEKQLTELPGYMAWRVITQG